MRGGEGDASGRQGREIRTRSGSKTERTMVVQTVIVESDVLVVATEQRTMHASWVRPLLTRRASPDARDFAKLTASRSFPPSPTPTHPFPPPLISSSEMYALQKRAGPLGMYNPSAMKISKPADALAAFDKHKTDRGLPSALTPAQLKRAAQKEVDDGDDAYSSLADQRACGSLSRAGGSGAGGGGGKGKERESLAPQNEAERKAMRREEQERDRESVWAREWEAKRNREKVEPRVLGVVPDELNSSDDDDLPDVGALGRQRHVVKGKNKVAVAVTVDASERKFQEHQGKADKRGKVEELSFELSFSSTPSSSALPNIKKKTEEEMAGPRIEFSFTASRHRPQPKASTSKLVHSLDSDDDDSSTAFPPPQTTKNVKRPIDLGRSSPSPRRLSSSARRASQSPDGSSDEVESAVSPRRAPLSRPRPKAKVNNRPLRDTANPFAHPDNKKPSSPSKSSSLDASRFPDPKPSELKSASSFGQLPDSSREETPESEPRDVIHDVAGMKLVSKARRKVALSPKSKSRKEQAERDLRDREAKGAGEDNIEDRFEDLLDTGSEEEVVNLKGKQPVQAQGERKSVVRSSSVDKVTLAMAEEMKESEEKQKKLALYGEEDVVYETGEWSSRLCSVASPSSDSSLVQTLRHSPSEPRTSLHLLFGTPPARSFPETPAPHRQPQKIFSFSANDLQPSRRLHLDDQVHQRLHAASVGEQAASYRREERVADGDQLGRGAEEGAGSDDGQAARGRSASEGQEQVSAVCEGAGGGSGTGDGEDSQGAVRGV